LKKQFLIFLLVLCSFISGFAQIVQAQEVGRYQIFQGKYTHTDLDNNTSTEMNEIFLLDTTDGNLQVYVSSMQDGKQKKYWAPALIDETNQSFTIVTTTPIPPTLEG
jgi:hypothetical protein